MYSFITILLLISTYALLHYRKLDIKLQVLSKDKVLSSRGILALLVILHHLSFRLNFPPKWLFVPLGAMIVGVFFLVSGYGLICSYEKKGDAYLQGFLGRRFGKLLLPFFIVIIVWNIEEIFLYPNYSITDAYLLMKNGDTNGILPYSWYIIVQLFFYIVFYISYKFIALEPRRILTIFICWMLFYVTTRYILNWERHWYFTSHMFLLGFLYYKGETFIQRFNAHIWIFILFLVAIISCMNFRLSDILFNTAFSLLFICGITILNIKSRILNSLGEISYELYIVQALPLFALKDTCLTSFSIAMICLVIDIILAYTLHLIIMKFYKKWSSNRI